MTHDASWYEIWDKLRSSSNVAMSKTPADNIGALQVTIRYRFQTIQVEHPNTAVDFSLMPEQMDEEMVKDPFEVSFQSFFGVGEAAGARDLGEGPSPGEATGSSSSSRRPGSTSNFMEDMEDMEDYERSILEIMSSYVVSKETLAVLKSVQRVMTAFGQGLETSNASFAFGVFFIENYFASKDRYPILVHVCEG